MDTKQPRRPELQFRVLIIGRANAGKTSIFQRVCETTESPIIYRRRQLQVSSRSQGSKSEERESVRGPIISPNSNLIAHQVTLNPTMEVSR